MWLLDTNICIAFLEGREAALTRRISQLGPTDAALCSVVRAELMYGARHSERVNENLRTVERLFELFPSLPFDDDAADTYGVVRAQLRRLGTPIGANDMLIAATALSADATLVTRNEREFRQVPGLRLEVW